MGCVTGRDGTSCPTSNEKPAHSVTLSSFYIGKYELTQAQWKAVMAGHPLENIYALKADDQLPAENMSWLDIDTAFLPRLRKLTGKSYRLPYEAEWEYAARGCKASNCENFNWSGSDNINEVAWHSGNASTARPVGQKNPNRLGIYDMSGNVFEWVYDWYSTYTTDAQTNPTGPTNARTYRVVRSGSFADPVDAAAGWHRVATRGAWAAPDARRNKMGFRVVLPAQ
jgi:formylglycine-generating enzyme required for sulfatase activity